MERIDRSGGQNCSRSTPHGQRYANGDLDRPRHCGSLGDERTSQPLEVQVSHLTHDLTLRNKELSQEVEKMKQRLHKDLSEERNILLQETDELLAETNRMSEESRLMYQRREELRAEADPAAAGGGMAVSQSTQLAQDHGLDICSQGGPPLLHIPFRDYCGLRQQHIQLSSMIAELTQKAAHLEAQLSVVQHQRDELFKENERQTNLVQDQAKQTAALQKSNKALKQELEKVNQKNLALEESIRKFEKDQAEKASRDAVAFTSFENSTCKQVFDDVPYPCYDHEVTMSVHQFLVKGLVEIPDAGAHHEQCSSFFQDLTRECKMRFIQELKASSDGSLEALDPETQAEVMWTSDLSVEFFGKERELCWLVNWCIRYGNRWLLNLLMPFIKALNRFAAQPSIKRFQPRQDIPWKMLVDWKLFRGGGFKMVFKDFFTVGKSFRIMGFWATTPIPRVTTSFIERSCDYAQGIEPIRWVIKIHDHQKCHHVDFISRSLVRDDSGQPTEDEFLFTQFSSFRVEELHWQTHATIADPHQITLWAYPDNLQAPRDLPLAPWS